MTNVLNDLDVTTTSLSSVIAFHNSPNESVHAGFAREYTGFKGVPKFQPLLTEITRLVGEGWHVLCTGHSLGGALATIFAAEVLTAIPAISPTCYWERQRISLVTFGSPRTGNRAFAEWINGYLRINLRVEEEGDIVPRLPGQTGDLYWHRGRCITIQRSNNELSRSTLIGEQVSVLVPIPTPVTVGERVAMAAETLVTASSQLATTIIGATATLVDGVPVAGPIVQGFCAFGATCVNIAGEGFITVINNLTGSARQATIRSDCIRVHRDGYRQDAWRTVPF